jgi:hypothetical protein
MDVRQKDALDPERIKASGAHASEQVLDRGAGANVHQSQAVRPVEEIASDDSRLPLMIGVDHPEMVVKSARITFGCHVSFLRVVDTPKEGAILAQRGD